jgi:hypothetical protein
MYLDNNYDQKIVQTLEKTAQPLDIEKIRIAAGIGNWNTALKHCLELMLNRKIEGQKTSKSWVFWCKNKQIEPFNTLDKTKRVEA